MCELSTNLELLFTEHSDEIAGRIRAAATLGIQAVEIWSWRHKDIDGMAEAIADTGVALETMCVDPMVQLVDRSRHDDFLAAVTESAAVADRLGCPYLVTTAGKMHDDMPLAEQHQAIVDGLRAAAGILKSYPVTLLLENLNSRVDHIGTYLDSTSEALEILDKVASPRVKLLYDHYHSLVMGERPEIVLSGRMNHVAHVQIADIPGRNEPGTGTVDWRQELAIMRKLGYKGRLGLEYVPKADTVHSIRYIKELVAATR